jgi:hypothetical protein
VIEHVPEDETDAQIASCHPDIQAMVAYWRGKAAGRRMPCRSDIDPSDLKRYLPRISLIDVVPDARRFVYRLVGTEEAAARGNDPTGLSVSEGYFGPNPENSVEHYEYVARHRVPFCYRGKFRAPDDAIEEEDVIFLPLSDDGESVNMILVFYHDYQYRSRVDGGSVLLRYRSRPDDPMD